MLPWGVVAGFLAFGELPSWNTLVGAVVVAASGTYNVYRERVRRAEERAAAIKAVALLRLARHNTAHSIAPMEREPARCR